MALLRASILIVVLVVSWVMLKHEGAAQAPPPAGRVALHGG